MSNKNEVFEYLIDQLRQQVTSNRCEAPAHEVLSLKNQLRDMSAQIKELHLALIKATGDAEAYKLIRKGGRISDGQRYVVGEHGPEQSGCRKDDTQECDHHWIIAPGLFIAEGHKDNVPGSRFCCECGAREWGDNEYKQKEDTQECEHDWVLDGKGDYFVCAKCGKQEAELIDCQHTNTVGLRKGFAPGFTKKCLDCGAKLK